MECTPVVYDHEDAAMKPENIRPYILSCFLLTLPVMIWNIILTDNLPSDFQPDIFWSDIPSFIAYGENISRALVFGLALLMPLRIATPLQKNGLLLYIAGVLVYFASWIVLISFPESAWSNSLPGFMAPAYTPLFWLMGIALVGDSLYFNLPYRRWLFIAIALVFLLFHNLHTYMIFHRTH